MQHARVLTVCLFPLLLLLHGASSYALRCFCADTGYTGQHTNSLVFIEGMVERRGGESNSSAPQQQQAASSSSGRHRGPRSLYLRRSDHGFGFTLRHFIVYPPEPSMLAGERRVRPGGNRLDEPMDTIFVKHVREKSAAHAAGLATGDRLVCVNGASVTGLSYAQYFSETAHNPYTNQRPWEIRQRDLYPDQGMKSRSSAATMLSTYQPGSPAHRSLPRPGSGGTSSRRSSEGSVLPQWRSCHAPFNGHAPLSLQGPQRAASVDRECNNDDRRRESTASLPPNVGTTDSSPRLSIASSLDANEADSVITRIKKSFEQKEEFLKRPNQPIWLPSSSSSASSTCSNSSQPGTLIPREFYAHPQKFQRPLWPPTQQQDEQQNGPDELEQESEPLSPRAQFMCGGAVTNVPAPSRIPSASDGTSLRLQQQQQQSSPLRTQQSASTQQQQQQQQQRPFVSTLARITENQPVQSTNVVPVVPIEVQQMVSRRARQFESGRVEEDRTVLYRSELARLSAKKVVPDVAHRKQEFESKSRSLDAAGEFQIPPFSTRHSVNAGGNSVTAVMGRPPRAPSRTQTKQPQREQEPEQQRSARQLPSLFLSGNCVIPVGGRYVPCDVDAGWLDDDESSPSQETPARSDPPRQEPPALLVSEPVPTSRSRSNSVDQSWTPPAHQRLSSSSIGQTSPAVTAVTREETPRPARPTQLSLQNPLRPPSPPPASTAESVQHQQAPEPPESARTPALVPPGRGDVTPVAVTSVQLRRPRHKTTASADEEEARKNIHRLRSFFSEQAASPVAQSTPTPPARPEGVLREGWLHCKLSLQDGKTATGGEETAVPLRGCLVDAAADYTKKKHVLRLHTPAGSQLLLQAEDPHDMAHWLQLLRPRAQEGSADDLSSEPPTSPGPGSSSPPQALRLSPQAAHKGIRKLTTSFRNRSPTGQSPLRKIQGASPSSPTTPHPEGATIGVPLEDCPMSSISEYVPFLVDLCTNIVEERGLDVIGIYRVPGNNAAVAFLTESVNKGLDETSLQDPRWNDVNVISSLLKSFFRRLPDSLFTSELYPLFMVSDRLEDPNARFRRIRKLHSHSNKMEARNLAIVFGPTLMRASEDNMVAMVTDMPHQCRIVESLISHALAERSTKSQSCGNESTGDKTDTTPPSSAGHDSAHSGMSVASSILSSVLFSGNIVKSIHAPQTGPAAPVQPSPPQPCEPAKPCDGATIHTYAGLSASTQERIRRFEMETKAMMSRDPAKHRGETKDLDKQKLELDWQKAKQELESDILDEIADNPSEIRKKLPELEMKSNLSSKPPIGATSPSKTANDRTAQAVLNSLRAIRRGNSAENLAASAAAAETPNQKVTPNGTLKRLKTGKEQALAERSTKSQSCGNESTGDKTDTTPPSSAGHDSAHSGMSVASSILSSVLFSGNIVKSIHAPQTGPAAPVQPSPPQPCEPAKPCDGATIHTYAGLSASTQERIRRFEMETKAMMSRDPAKHRGETKDLDKQKLELDWQKAKQELESDILDEIADNPSEIRKKLPELEMKSNLSSKPPIGATSPSKTANDRTAQAVLNSLRAIRRGNSAENLAASAAAAETPNQKVTPNGTLKRLKTGKEQPGPAVQSPSSLGSLRCGSLDSLHDACFQEPRNDRPRSDASDDGHDLLASLTSTFDKKMRSLMKSDEETVTEMEQQQQLATDETEPRPYRDPSLHRTKPLGTSSPSAGQDSGGKV
ncbi:hypothetical protein B566_EDAN008900, partial [Ephemera danica]